MIFNSLDKKIKSAKSFYKFKGFMKEWYVPVNAVFFENVIASDYF